MRGSKHILILSPTPSHPQDAGNRKRIYEVCESLRQLGGIIHFIYVPREWDRTLPYDHYRDMTRHWDYFHIVPPVQSAVHETKEDYFELDAWWDVGIEYMINWKRLTQRFDMVIVNYVFYSKCLTLFSSDTVKVLDTHDVMSDRQRILDKNNIKREFFYTTKAIEKSGLDRADLVLAIKESEAKYFSEITERPILVLGHKEPERFVGRDFHTARVFGLIGSANSINKENFERFFIELNNKLPIDRPNFHINLAGHVCMLLDTSPYSFVKWLGPVPDVEQFYDGLDVVLLPFDFSTGLKIKTVEALSFGIPIIGTANAFDGLVGDDSILEHSSLTISDMVDIVIENIINPGNLNNLASASRRVFKDYMLSVNRSISALYEMADSDKVTTKPRAMTTPFARVDAKKIVFASQVAFWEPKSLYDLSITKLVDQLRYDRHIEYFYNGNIDDNTKKILFREKMVDHVHEITNAGYGEFTLSAWATDHLSSSDELVLITDDIDLIPIFAHSTAPRVLISLGDEVPRNMLDEEKFAGVICNQSNTKAMMSRYLTDESILVAPYFPFFEPNLGTQKGQSIRDYINRPSQSVIGIGCDDSTELLELFEHMGVFSQFGNLTWRVCGTESPSEAKVQTEHYPTSRSADFIAGLSIYVSLYSGLKGADPIIPYMLFLGIPVIIGSRLGNRMDLSYTKNLSIVEGSNATVQAMIKFITGGAAMPCNKALDAVKLASLAQWKLDIKKWITYLYSDRSRNC